jgi:abequosyltransferase
MNMADESLGWAKQNTSIILTVAIPTYNRAVYLDTCLTRLDEELNNLDRDLRKLVKVYISNNASTDETLKVIQRHKFRGAGDVEVIHNEKNIGAEDNVIQCYEAATSPYVWILGDDDMILFDGLKRVVNALQLYQPDIIYLGNYHFLENYLEHYQAIENGKESLTVIKSSLLFARKVNIMLTFISSLVVRSKNYCDYSPGVLPRGYLAQLTWILPLLRDGNKFGLIESKVVAAKGGNSGGYGLIQVFGENLQKVTSTLLKSKPKEAKAIMNGTVVNFFPGFILEMRSGDSKFNDKENMLDLRHTFAKNWRYYIFLLPLIKLPLFLAYRYNSLLNILRRLLGYHLI